MRVRFWRPALAAVIAAAAVSPLVAGEPAVSALNFKVTGEGGTVNDDDAWAGLLQVTAPIAHDWGVQGEAGVFGENGEMSYGLAGHVFTRDPAQYLLGGFGAWMHGDDADLDVGHIGVEGEYYLEHISFIANTGYQFGDGFVDDTWFGEVQARWYANDDFALSGGVSFNDDVAVTEIGAEWRVGAGTSLPGLALRGDVQMGDNDYDKVSIGATYYFGPDASLKDRHRKQDPDSALFDLLQAVESACPPAAPPPVLPDAVVTSSASCSTPIIIPLPG